MRIGLRESDYNKMRTQDILARDPCTSNTALHEDQYFWMQIELSDSMGTPLG